MHHDRDHRSVERNRKSGRGQCKNSQIKSGVGRKGPEPRLVLGAPLILANYDLQRSRVITQLSRRWQSSDLPAAKRKSRTSIGSGSSPTVPPCFGIPKGSQATSGVGRQGPEPRLALGAPPYSCQLRLAKRSPCEPAVGLEPGTVQATPWCLASRRATAKRKSRLSDKIRGSAQGARTSIGLAKKSRYHSVVKVMAEQRLASRRMTAKRKSRTSIGSGSSPTVPPCFGIPKGSQATSGVGRQGPEPRLALGAPPYSCQLRLAKRSPCEPVVGLEPGKVQATPWCLASRRATAKRK